MELKLKRKDKKPLYQQIVDYFESAILKGDIHPGSILPTERELAMQFEVNRSTVATAYSILRSSGLIISTQGRGTIVNHTLQTIHNHHLINWKNYINHSYYPIFPITNRIFESIHQRHMINLATNNLRSDFTLPQDLYHKTLSLDGFYSEENEMETKQILANVLQNFHIEANAEDLILTGGMKHALLLILTCLLHSGDSVAMETPSYLYTSQLFSTRNLNIMKLPVEEDGIDPEMLSSLFKKHKIKMVFTNPTFQNPTGTTLDINRRKRLIEICSQLKIPIIEVCSSNALKHDSKMEIPPSLYSLSEEKSFIINIGCFSDILGTDSDFGWIIAPKAVKDLFTEAKLQMGIGVSFFNKHMFIDMYHQEFWQKNLVNKNKLLANRKQTLIQSIQHHLGDSIQYTNNQGGYYLWCRNNHIHNEKIFLEKCIQNGVLIAPGSVFGSEIKGYFRLSYGQFSNYEVKEGIKRLSHALVEE